MFANMYRCFIVYNDNTTNELFLKFNSEAYCDCYVYVRFHNEMLCHDTVSSDLSKCTITSTFRCVNCFVYIEFCKLNNNMFFACSKYGGYKTRILVCLIVAIHLLWRVGLWGGEGFNSEPTYIILWSDALKVSYFYICIVRIDFYYNFIVLILICIRDALFYILRC